MAKKANYKQILICEDDVTFHLQSIDIWKAALQELPNNWDILLGGISNFDCNRVCKSKYKNLVKINDFSGEHMMLVNEKAYDILLTYINNLKLNKKILHFDRFLGSLAKQKILNIYCTVPFTSVPIYKGFSNIRNKYVNDEDYFKITMKNLNNLIKK